MLLLAGALPGTRVMRPPPSLHPSSLEYRSLSQERDHENFGSPSFSTHARVLLIVTPIHSPSCFARDCRKLLRAVRYILL